MKFAVQHQEYLLFASGLCLAALAGFAWLSGRKSALCGTWQWLIATLGVLGLSNFIVLIGKHRNDAPVCRLAALLFTVVAIVTLTELAREQMMKKFRGGFGRWLYAPLAIGMIAGVFFIEASYLEFAARALLTWQAGVLLFGYLMAEFEHSEEQRKKESIIAVGAMLAFLPMQLLQLHLLAVIPLIVALVAIYRVDRKTAVEGETRGGARKWGIPTTVVVALIVGWFVFSPASEMMVVVSHAAVLDSETFDTASPTSPTAQLLWKAALALLPIGLVAALFAGLKRLPGVS